MLRMILATTLCLFLFLTLVPAKSIFELSVSLSRPREMIWQSDSSPNHFQNPISKLIAQGASSWIRAITTGVEAGQQLSEIILCRLMLWPFFQRCNRTRQDSTSSTPASMTFETYVTETTRSTSLAIQNSDDETTSDILFSTTTLPKSRVSTAVTAAPETTFREPKTATDPSTNPIITAIIETFTNPETITDPSSTPIIKTPIETKTNSEILTDPSTTSIAKAPTKSLTNPASITEPSAASIIPTTKKALNFPEPVTDPSTTPVITPPKETLTTPAITTAEPSTTTEVTTTSEPLTSTVFPETIVSTRDYNQCRKDAVADIILLMASSISVGSENWSILLGFVANIIKNFQLGPSGVQFAAMSYSYAPVKLFDLKTYSDYDSIEKSLKSAKFLNAQTMTYKAYEFIQTNSMFGTKAGGRPFAPDLIVIFIPRESDSPTRTITAGQKLRDNGVSIIGVGIGPQAPAGELNAIAKSPDDVILASGYDSLNQIKTQLVSRICQGAVAN